MDLDAFDARRTRLNQELADEDDFFRQFAELDDEAYEEGAIPTAYKELIGLAISLVTRCDDCITYHLQRCRRYEVERSAIIEAIKLGVIAGGSVTYPSARHAIEVLDALDTSQ